MQGQLSIFDLTMEQFKIDKPIRLIELFAGVGSQAMALRDLGADFEHYRVVEFDKYAIASYNAIHGTNFPTMDITQVNGADLGIADTDKYCYILTYSFPCQDLSLAGLGKGMQKGIGTRSGLLWEVERLLNESDHLPQVLLMENVPQVHSKNNMDDFKRWIEFLESKGYSNFWQDMNAKDFGIPQSRNRTFMVSLLGNYSYTFPQTIPLELRLKDMLEDVVDEKYYINNEKADKLIEQLVVDGLIENRQTGIDLTINQPKQIEVANCIKSRYDAGISNQRSDGTVTAIVTEALAYDEQNKICRTDGTVGTLTTDGSSPKHNNRVIETIKIKQATSIGYAECELGGVEDLSYPTSNTRRGRVQGGGNICPTLTATETGVCKIESRYRIRKLTPKECWRLMDFTDEDFHKAESVNSNTQLYKQAGNSIVKNCLVAIFGQMLPDKENIYREVKKWD